MSIQRATMEFDSIRISNDKVEFLKGDEVILSKLCPPIDYSKGHTLTINGFQGEMDFADAEQSYIRLTQIGG